MFRGLTTEQIKQREERFQYPPRLQIECEQNKPCEPLHSSFQVYKRYKELSIKAPVPIARFLLVKKASGMHIAIVIYIMILLPCTCVSVHDLLNKNWPSSHLVHGILRNTN